MRSLMSKTQPNRKTGAAGQGRAPILHDCVGLDPWLKDQTRVVEKRHTELGGKIAVLVTGSAGHFPLQPEDPKPIVDFIVSHQN
ncbi:MAG: hypothetical protein ABSG03_30275 [Bryobacteraceae bacterium]|jgi:hypothetical protein